jgi:hydrogenase nickel incorporation protein HypA/HybF
LHELSLAEAIVRIACEQAGRSRVSRVEVRVGRLRQIAPGALAFAFEAAAKGTPAEGAELSVEEGPLRIECRDCGEVTDVSDLPFACAACGGASVEVVAGDELVVEAVEVEDDPVAR